MSVIQSLLLGILQGIAEFLPISSSGHLAVAKAIFNLSEIPLLYDVLLHLATLLAVCLVFRHTIADLFGVLFRWIGRKACNDDGPKQKMVLSIILGTIVTGVLGILSSKLIPELPLFYVYIGFLITAALLIFSSRYSSYIIRSRGTDTFVSPLKGAFIGLAQGIGTLPGISRSGITISASLFAGIDRQTAGEYSFVLSIPAVLGAFILEAKDLGEVSEAVGFWPLAVGFIAAFVAGFFALKFLMKLINKGKLEYFAWYLIPLAVVGLIFFR